MSDYTNIPAVIPVIAVDDLRKAIEFYEKLGFKEAKEFSYSDESGQLVHAHLYKDGSVLFLGRIGVSYYESGPRAEKIRKAETAERGLGVTMILQTEDLEKLYETIKSHDLEILYEPADEYYGDRVFVFLDPFGYEWKASQSLGRP
jgi:uncharacterized glyoxalase superfamily protein PhnB